MKVSQRHRVIHVGQTGQYERTDPDYIDKRMAQLAKDYSACPKHWRDTFLSGMSAMDIRMLKEMGVKL